AVRDPIMARQFKNRAEPALHAALGLDSAKRLEIERLLCAHLQDPKLPHAHQADLALIAVVLGGLTPEAGAKGARTLIEALDHVKDPIAYQELAVGLANLAASIEADEAARLCLQAATVLLRILPKRTHTSFEPIATGLAALAARLEARDAARVCSQAAASLTMTMNANSSRSWVEDAFSKSVIVLAPYLEPEEAANVGAAVVQQMNGFSSVDKKPDALAALAPRMNPKEASRICAQAAAGFVAKLKDPFERAPFLLVWIRGIKAVAPYLEPGEAAKAASVLTK